MITTTTHSQILRQQQGFVLIVALVLLLILTILGLAAARSTSLEEKMAGNTRDHELAFQAAEAALRAAESGLRTGQWPPGSFTANTNKPAGFGTSAGLYYDDPNPASLPATQIWQVTTGQNVWTTSGATLNYADVTSAAFPGVAQQPLFIIEQMPPVPLSGINLGQTQFGGPPITIQLYRITALGTGGDANSQVMLQVVDRP